MQDTFHVGCPNIGDRAAFLRRINDMLDRRWFSNDGPLVREFETQISYALGVPNVIVMCNATVALEIASRALNLSGEVILPSYTFVATAHALQWQGITPVFADIDPNTHNIEPSAIEALITPRTTGIVGVHVWGRACDTRAIESVARRYQLKVMYDASHAFGCSVDGQMLGNFGSCEVFSFHATKFINSFEGGAVVTHDNDLAAKMRLMRNFGFRGIDDVGYLGVNGKMSEACAAMGLTSIEAMESIIEVNHRNYLAYQIALTGLPGISLLSFHPDRLQNYQYVVIEVDPYQCPKSRDEIVAALHMKNIMARKYFWPGCHRMEPYRSIQPDTWKRLGQTERVASRVIVLPTGQTVDVDSVNFICSVISDCLFDK